MNFYAVYHDAPRKVSRSAVRFRVKEIAPAADSLSQRHARDCCVYHVEESDLLVTAYEISRYDAEYKAAVDGEPAGARIYDVKKCMVISSVKKNVPRASAHYADRYGKKQRVEQVVRFYAALRAAPVCDSAS